MSQVNLKNIIKKLVQEYISTFKEQLGDMASTGATSDDGNNITSPRIGGSYRDDYEEIQAYILKNVYGGDGGHYKHYPARSSMGIEREKMGMFELKKYIKEVLEELDEDAYGSATLTTQGQRKKRFKTPHGGPPGMWVEKINEDQAAINDNNRRIVNNNIENLYLTLDNQEIQVDMQKSQMQKSVGDQTKGIADATAKEQEIRKELEEVEAIRAQTAAELGKLQRQQKEEGAEFPPQLISTIETLEKEKQGYDDKIKSLETKIKQADDTEQNMIKQRSAASGAAASGIANAEKALNKARQNAKKQAATMRRTLSEDYFKQRSNKNLMEYIDSYKREILLEKATSQFFNLFDEGKTDEEILRLYAEQGVVVPEPFVTKLRKKHEGLKHDKLDLEEFEREAKNFKKVPLIDEDEVEIEVKELSSRLFKENEIKKRYPMPPEIKIALQDRLKLNPLNRFIKNLKAVNSIPPSYRIFLHNGQFFDIVYEEFSLMVKIGPDNYYLDTIEEKNYAIKHINRLLTQPTLKQGDVEDEEIDDILPTPTAKKPGRPPSASPTPSLPEPTPITPPTPELET